LLAGDSLELPCEKEGVGLSLHCGAVAKDLRGEEERRGIGALGSHRVVLHPGMIQDIEHGCPLEGIRREKDAEKMRDLW